MPANRRSFIFCLFLTGAVALLVGILVAHPAHASPGAPLPKQAPVELPTCGPLWFSQTTPNSGTDDNVLAGVSALTSNDVWAAGFYTDTGGVTQTLIEHWNGTAWSIVSSPNVGTSDNFLQAVSARTGSDIWAVGYYRTAPGNPWLTLILHYNGTQWTQTASPSPGSAENYLYGVAYVSATDAWAVGFDSNTTNIYMILTLRWNGTQWNPVSSPNPFLSVAGLRGVVVVSPSEVWAVGVQADISLTLRTYVIKWNGSTWNPVTTPSTAGCVLTTVAIASPGNLWAAGACQATNYQTLILHYNGSTWSAVNTPNPGSGDNALGGLAVVSPSEAYAVGGYSDGTITHTLALYWDGISWSQVASQDPGTTSNELLSATVSTDINGAIAVGSQAGGGPNQTLAETKVIIPCEATATPTVIPSTTAVTTATATATSSVSTPTATSPVINSPTATVTAGVGTATATAITPVATVPASATSHATVMATSTPAQPTGTPGVPTSTPTVCSLQFTDVPVGSTFYPYVRCLSCRGIINGYSTGCGTGNPCFRPNNNVTRGQLAKIISNSAGFSDPQSTRLFQDVPPGSTFFDYIGRLASRGYMSGYPCGGAGEPCVPPGNLPYFRPNNNATRGQISKIDANAAGFNDPQTTQLFQDVPPGSTYYTFTARLASRNIMSGYACGGSGEPCVPPTNLPYFRPNNNATRGQTSKIVANTFYPDCQTP